MTARDDTTFEFLAEVGVPVADVIFVHGLRAFRGNPDADWRSRAGDPDAFWPKWLEEDVHGVRVGRLTYSAAASQWFGRAMHLEDRATNLLAVLRARGIGDRPIIFVTHSLGGVVVKQMLFQSHTRGGADGLVAAACRAVVFLATPHTGSALASLVKSMRILRAGSAIRALVRDNAHLMHLARDYRAWAAQRSDVQHLVMYETRPVGGAVLVVPPGSADPGIADAILLPVGADHFDIALPASRDSFVYEQVVRLVRGVVSSLGTAQLLSDREFLSSSAIVAMAEKSRLSRYALATEIIPSMPRAALVTKIAEGERPIQVLFGEGGLGKSVIAAQIFDALESSRDALFIPCSMLRISQRGDRADEIDASLGRLAADAETGLSSVLKRMRARPVVVLDTIDILLNQTNGDEIAELLRRLVTHADLVVTCRAREWHDLLAPYTDLLELKSTPVPSLGRDLVLEWVDAYTAANSASRKDAARFRRSVEAALEGARGLAVLESPLRLAMACELYGGAGSLPTGLTATRLYSESWTVSVSAERDGRRNTAGSTAKERAALEIARAIWRGSEKRFVEDIAPIEDTAALNELVSEGLVARVGGRIHFFHQTFAEFAVARYLAIAAADSDFQRLGAGLRGRISGYWGIASHLLLADLSIDRFDVIRGVIPIDYIEGTRSMVIAAFALRDVARARTILFDVAERQPDEFASASDLLESVPDLHAETAVLAITSALPALRANVTGAVHALGAILSRLSAKESGDALKRALRALIARRTAGENRVDSDVRLLLDTVLRDSTPLFETFLASCIETYPALPMSGQQVICAAAHAGDDQLRTKFLDVALASPVPPGAIEECAVLMRNEWLGEESRYRRGWSDWATFLAETLPQRWDVVQALALGSGRSKSQVLEIVTECLRPHLGVPRDRILNVALLIATDDPASVVEAIFICGVSGDRAAVAALAHLAVTLRASLDASDTANLIEMLLTTAAADPRAVWPAIARLSAIDSATVALVLGELRRVEGVREQQPGWGRIAASAARALGETLGAQGLRREWPRLKPLLEMIGDDSAEEVGTIWGIMAATDEEARNKVDCEFNSDRVLLQKRMVTAVMRTREELSVEDRSRSLPWTTSLLRVNIDGVVTRLADSLKSDVATDAWTVSETEIVVARFLQAIERQGDPHTTAALLDLVASITHEASPAALLSRVQVQEILSRYQELLVKSIALGQRSHHLTALYNQYADMLRRVVKAVLGVDEMEALVRRLLVEIDAGSVSRGARLTLGRSLTAWIRATPESWPILEREWAHVSDTNRWAIAYTALNGVVSDRAGTALRLAARADCPVSVAAWIHRSISS